MIHHCKTCGLLTCKPETGQSFCAMSRLEVNPEKDGCTKYNAHPLSCEICKGYIAHPLAVVIDPDEKGLPHIICRTCAEDMGTCKICDKVTYCAFEADNSSIPKHIRKVTSNGRMQMETLVMNPELIEKTCKKDCPCWNDECQRIHGCCGNAIHTYPEGG